MIRLWVEPGALAAGPLALDGDDFHYLVRVRRLRPGDSVELFDGAGRVADAAVTRIDDAAAVLEVATPRDAPAPARPELTVLLSLIKGDRTDWAIQKLVELGVDRIVPVRADRSVVKLTGTRAADRVSRYQAVARAAAQQCRRADVPEVGAVATLPDALTQAPTDALKLMLYERGGQGLAAALPAATPARVVLLVGPEGGFSPAEVDAATAAGFAPVGFGPRILRAETAAVAGAAVLGFVLGDLRGAQSI